MASVPAAQPPLLSRGRRFLALQNELARISYLLDTGVLSEMERHAVSGLQLVPRRGLEVAGVLYGYVERDRDGSRVLVVESAQPIESEHKFGPDFNLSDEDRDALPEPGERKPIGIYRSHLRKADPPAAVDKELWRDAGIDGPEGVLLVVHPAMRAPSTATLFSGGIQGFEPYATFPLRLNTLEKEGFVIVAEPGAVAPVEMPERQHSAPNRMRWVAWAGALLAVILTLFIARPRATTPTEETRERLEPARVVEQAPPPPESAPAEVKPSPVKKNKESPAAEEVTQRVIRPARMTLEVAPESTLRRFWNRIPVARKMQKGFREGDDYTPPVAGRQPTPAYPLRLARELANVSPLVIRIDIDERGRARQAKVLSKGIRPDIVTPTVAALSRWQFRPARSGGRPVASRVNVVLHF